MISEAKEAQRIFYCNVCEDHIQREHRSSTTTTATATNIIIIENTLNHNHPSSCRCQFQLKVDIYTIYVLHHTNLTGAAAAAIDHKLN